MSSARSGNIRDPKRAAELAAEILASKPGFDTVADLLSSTIDLCEGHARHDEEKLLSEGGVPQSPTPDDILYTRERVWRDMESGLIRLSQGAEPSFAQERAIEMAPTFIEMIARQQIEYAKKADEFAKHAGNDDAYATMVASGTPDHFDDPSPAAKADPEVDYQRYKFHTEEAQQYAAAATHLRNETLSQFKELASAANLMLAPVRER
jgi:hypothetical protein